MKVFRNIFILALLAWYFSGPYRAVSQFETAVEQGDRDAVMRLIDPEDFKESMKDLMFDVAFQGAKEASGDRLSDEQISSKLESAMNGGPLGKMVDEQLKPERFAQIIIAGSKANGKKGGDVSKNWVNPVKFAVAEKDSPIKAIFKFKGLGWKLSGLEATPKDLAKLMPGFGK